MNDESFEVGIDHGEEWSLGEADSSMSRLGQLKEDLESVSTVWSN